MKILKKGTSESAPKGNSSKSVKTINTNINIREWSVPVGLGIMLVGSLFILWPSISMHTTDAVNKYKYNRSGWTTKTETETYPVSHIRINKETEYYDENQLNAGYSLLNYKALKDKGDAIALNIIKTKALEGDNDHYRYKFTIDGIDYNSVDETSDSELFIDGGMNVFDEVEYKKGLNEPEVKVYYKLKYHYGKLKKKEMKYETTLILPD